MKQQYYVPFMYTLILKPNKSFMKWRSSRFYCTRLLTYFMICSFIQSLCFYSLLLSYYSFCDTSTALWIWWLICCNNEAPVLCSFNVYFNIQIKLIIHKMTKQPLLLRNIAYVLYDLSIYSILCFYFVLLFYYFFVILWVNYEYRGWSVAIMRQQYYVPFMYTLTFKPNKSFTKWQGSRFY